VQFLKPQSFDLGTEVEGGGEREEEGIFLILEPCPFGKAITLMSIKMNACIYILTMQKFTSRGMAATIFVWL
jgi:hypothetical protein